NINNKSHILEHILESLNHSDINTLLISLIYIQELKLSCHKSVKYNEYYRTILNKLDSYSFEYNDFFRLLCIIKLYSYSKNNNQINLKRNYLNINQLYKLVSISVKIATENYFSTNKNYKKKLFEIIYYLLEKDLKNIKQQKKF